jgi:hypothetical protein
VKKVQYFIQERKEGKWKNITFPISHKEIKPLIKKYQDWLPESKYRPVKCTTLTKIEVIDV